MPDLMPLSGSIVLVGSVILTAIFVPLTATFVLDGVLLAVRGNGARPLAKITGIGLAAAFVSFGLWEFGLIGVESNPTLQDFANGMRSAITTLLPWTVPLALLAFGVRTVDGRVK